MPTQQIAEMTSSAAEKDVVGLGYDYSRSGLGEVEHRYTLIPPRRWFTWGSVRHEPLYHFISWDPIEEPQTIGHVLPWPRHLAVWHAKRVIKAHAKKVLAELHALSLGKFYEGTVPLAKFDEKSKKLTWLDDPRVRLG
jgi:hypothetical protein